MYERGLHPLMLHSQCQTMLRAWAEFINTGFMCLPGVQKEWDVTVICHILVKIHQINLCPLMERALLE